METRSVELGAWSFELGALTFDLKVGGYLLEAVGDGIAWKTEQNEVGLGNDILGTVADATDMSDESLPVGCIDGEVVAPPFRMACQELYVMAVTGSKTSNDMTKVSPSADSQVHIFDS